jgi:hypothetical protein
MDKQVLVWSQRCGPWRRRGADLPNANLRLSPMGHPSGRFQYVGEPRDPDGQGKAGLLTHRNIKPPKKRDDTIMVSRYGDNRHLCMSKMRRP